MRHLLHKAVELTGARLVDPGFLREPQYAHRLENPQRSQRIAVGRVFGRFKAHRHMALGAKVINLIRLHLLDDPNQVGAIGEIAVVEHKAGIAFMRILVEVINSAGVEAAGPAFEPVHHIALLKQQLS